MTRSEGKKFKSWIIQVVHVEEPHIRSSAALVLLAKKYFVLDKSIYTERRMHKLRNRWMKLQMKTSMDEMGGLTCQICGRKGLNPWTPDIHKKAVLDHCIEIAGGGDWRDPSNFQVLCNKCNDKKNNIFSKKYSRPSHLNHIYA